MGYIWVSAQSCSQQELLQLTELLKTDRDMQIILSCIPPLGRESRSATETKIGEVLVRLSIKPNLKGYHYLKTAVRICMSDREELNGITKRLYPSVAKVYGTTPDNVEHAIRHAILTAWNKGNPDVQRAVFGYCHTDGKRPTNAEFIMHLLEYLENMSMMLCS